MTSMVFGLIIFVISVNGIVLANTDENNCRKCNAGFFVKDSCTPEHDTICTKCALNHFMPLDNHLETVCRVCSVCASGFYETVKCSSSKDTICESCDNKIDTESFRVSCNKENVSQSDLIIPSDGIKIDSSSIEEPGSGAEEPDVVLNANVTVINDESILSIGNETEGSGEVILEIPKEGDIIPDETAKPSVLPISQNETAIIDEDLIPVSPPIVTQKTTTTTKATSVTTEASTVTTTKSPTETTKAPIVTTKSPTETTKAPIVTTKALTETTEAPTVKPTESTPEVIKTIQKTTTEQTLDLGDGIILDHENGDKSENTVIDITVIPLKEDNPLPEKSHVKDTTAMTDDSDKVSIGIVIAVAIIAAIIFFIIGFIASKYCRRRRQEVKLMNKLGSNGTRHNGSVPVLLGSGNSYRSNGIYDEIGKEANGKCSTRTLDEIVPVHQDNVYAVPDKRKKTEPEIKYIDETSDDDLDNKETSLDISSTELPDNVISPPMQNGGSRHNVDEGNDEIDESSPMLNEIESEINHKNDAPSEHDSLVAKS